ncbi:hypothetical protein Aperf_G00000117497 [Anoplocephala perfoliata]
MVKNEESRSAIKVENNPVASSDADSSVTSTAVAATTTGPLTPIQQQPSGQTRRVRDELDPAPHHTPADIRVLEILKRIRDEGNVGDEDSPPPKRKPGRARMTDRPSFTRQTPAPVLPQPTPSVSITATSSSAAAAHPLDSFKVPLSATLTPTTNLRPRGVATPPAQFRNGNPSTILLTTTNGTATAVPVTTSLVASGTSVTSTPTVTVIQQKPQSMSVTKAPSNVTQTTQQPTQQIGLELILPNGIRIPVSATACTTKSETRFTPISAAPPSSQKAGALVTTVPITPSSTPSKLWSPPQPSQPQTPQSIAVTAIATTTTTTTTTIPSAPSSITSTSSNSQQICSCSRSKCLKLYCDCFAAGRACGESCNCRHCYNNLADDLTKQTRDVAMRTALSRNPLAFKPKIETSGKHVLGCRCKRSHCLKGYCECYLAKIPCNQRCRCLGCSNEEASSWLPSMAAASTTTANTTTITTPTALKTPNDIQMTWLTAPSPCQQVSVTAGNTVSVVTASPISVVKANIASNTGVSTELVNAAAPRTITLNVPIKTLTPMNGSTNILTQPTGQLSSISTTSEMPSILLSQSYLAAVAAAGPSAQQNFLKCLNSVLPQATSSSQSAPPQLIIPGLVQTTAAPASQTAEGELTLVPISKLSSPVMVKTENAEISVENTNNSEDDGELINGQEDIEHTDSYAGYTEEELAFMQRLQQDRNSSSEVISQVKKEYTVTEPTEPIAESFSSTHSESPNHQNPSENIPMSFTSMIASLLRGSQLLESSSLDVGEQQRQQSEEEPSSGPLSPQSAPPSLCPSSGTDERANLHLRKSDEVRFLKQRVSDLETQICQLTELIRTQGEVMSQLSDTIQRLQQQYQNLPPPHRSIIISSSDHEH